MENSVSNEVSITKVKIKKEHINDDIKDFAETAMSELLGWYGYENPKDENGVTRKCRSHSASHSSESDSPRFTEGCGWCGKSVDENNGLVSADAVFCSEMCFSQSRRASFKKNKTCDWCRHVRHTVSYVDLQDGASQLQFCSDKCLNQYKMHIFCRETRAHLELHPHLHREESVSGTLITPDLWMRNCKSPDRQSPTPNISHSKSEHLTQTSPLPLLTVNHSSKTSNPEETRRSRLRPQKKSRKRCPATVTSLPNIIQRPVYDELPQDLRVRSATDPRSERQKLLPENSPILEKVICENPTNENCHSLGQGQEETENSTSQVHSSQLPVKKLLEQILPPATIFVPYPIILPLPIPIPIPIPIPNMLLKKEKAKADEFSQTEQFGDEDVQHVSNSSPNESVEMVKKDEVKPPNRRLLRKRKKITEPRSKVFIKSRKLVSSPAL